ncbi:MFS transporter [Leptospira kemamanensis]|uniref:MFS transporter n=1 Tax=Leptospira kemamanensis TaxID=2484942 RepID=A0A4R9JPM6_9LEPT|nr:MFS transporter [Leptospira kemamanensis]TGL53070.1 MFS transporter [Leptospira kemamanensis]
MQTISKTVLVLSLVSLFTDIASEMLYPILPIYLRSIGYSILYIGFLEGVAEVVAGYSKGYFGNLSDLKGKRVPFVQMGYALSAFSKPLLAISQIPIVVFFARTLDRLGKGVRTGARDAILANEATATSKAQVFGFHRSLDTLGAVLGPSVALIYLYLYPNQYIVLFYLAFLPGLVSIGLTFLLREKEFQIIKNEKKPSVLSFVSIWKDASLDYRKLVVGLLVFAFWNSSDVFLILKAKELGLNDPSVIGIYIFYNLVYAIFAYPLGIVADKIGLKTMFLLGLTLFALVYIMMGWMDDTNYLWVAFFFYGIYASATEGISKAWISNLVHKNQVGSAIGFYTALQSVATFFASLVAGWIWFQFGAPVTFFVTGAFAILVLVYFLVVPISEAPNT